MSSNQDLGLLLEADILLFIRIQTIFLAIGIAAFSFTKRGKMFSIISLIISLLLGVTLIIYYFMEKHRISKFDFAPRSVVSVIVSIMVAVVAFNVWMIYEVWHTEDAISLNEMVRGIESRMDKLNFNNNNKEHHSIANKHLLNLHSHDSGMKSNIAILGAVFP